MTSDSEIFEFTPFRLDLRRQVLSREGEPIELRPKTWAVLHLLVRRAGELIEKEELLAAVWPDTAVEEKSLNAAVAELRRALGDDARNPSYIATVHRRGFRFIAPVVVGGGRPTQDQPEEGLGPFAASAEPAIVGRDEELETLQRLAASSAQGEPNLVFVTGDAGMGKSALLDVFSELLPVEDTMLLGRARCPLHRGALSPWLAALDELLAGDERDVDGDVLARRAPALLARLPRTRAELANGEPSSDGASLDADSLGAEILAALAVLSSQRLCAVFLEDVHRADTPTLDVLAGISTLPAGSKLLVVATYRPVDALIEDHPVRALCRRLSEEEACREVRLDYLSRDAVARYVSEHLPDDEVGFMVAQVMRSTNGNPQAMKRCVEDALDLRAREGRQGSDTSIVGSADMLLLGRDQELDAIEALAAGGVAVVRGPAGVGKSSLVREAGRRATAAGHDVLVGSCRVAGSAPDFWPWIEMLRGYADRRPPELLRAAAGKGIVEVARLVPSIREALPDLPPALPIDPDSSRLLLFDAVAEFLRGAAELAPLTVVIEDLHDADASSLDLLQFVVRERGAAQLRFLCSTRDSEESAPEALRVFLDDIRREPETHEICLAGLAPTQTAVLVAGLAAGEVDSAVVDRMQQATAGNPLFLTHLWRHLVDEGLVAMEGGRWVGRFDGPHLGAPPVLRETVTRRFVRLSEDARQVISAAAVCGATFRFDIVRSVLDWSDERLLDALDLCLRDQVLEEVAGSPGRYRFAHFLLAEVLYADLSALRRARFHHAIAQAYEARPFHNSIAELAYHATRGASQGGTDQAVELCCRAAEEAHGQFAFDSEAGFFRAAIDVIDRHEVAGETGERRGELLLAMATALDHAGRGEAARSAFTEAAETAKAAANASVLARAALGLAVRGVSTDSGLLGVIDDALNVLGDTDAVLRARLLGRRPHALYLLPDTRGERELACEEALAAARSLNDPALLGEVLVGCLDGMFQSDNLDQQGVFTEELVRAAQDAGDPRLVFTAHAWRVVLAMTRGRLLEAKEEMQLCRELAAELRVPRFLWQATYFEAALEMAAGRVEEAEALALAAAEIGRSVNEDATAAVIWGQLLAFRGELGRVGDDDAAPSLQMSDRDTVALFERVRCFLPYALWEQGRFDEGRAAFDALRAEGLIENLPNDTSRNVRLPALLAVTEMCVVLGDVASAKELKEVLSIYSDQWVVAGWGVSVLAPVADLQAMVAGVLGLWEEAFSLFEQALAVERAQDARFAEARTLNHYARALLRRGSSGDAEKAGTLRAIGLERTQGLSMPRTRALLRGKQLG